MAIVSTVIMFLCFFTGFMVHLINRQSKSYTLLAGYASGCVILLHQLSVLKTAIDFGIWIVPFGLICLGELVRFHNKEIAISKELHKLLKRQNILINFDDLNEMPLNTPTNTVGDVMLSVIYKRSHSLVASVRFQKFSHLEFTPENFNVHVRLIEGDAKIIHKDFTTAVTSTGHEFTPGTPLKFETGDDTILEFNITKR